MYHFVNFVCKYIAITLLRAQLALTGKCFEQYLANLRTFTVYPIQCASRTPDQSDAG